MWPQTEYAWGDRPSHVDIRTHPMTVGKMCTKQCIHSQMSSQGFMTLVRLTLKNKSFVSRTTDLHWDHSATRGQPGATYSVWYIGTIHLIVKHSELNITNVVRVKQWEKQQHAVLVPNKSTSCYSVPKRWHISCNKHYYLDWAINQTDRHTQRIDRRPGPP